MVAPNVSRVSATDPNGRNGYLWELISDDIWFLVSKNRVRLKLKVMGTSLSLRDYVTFNGRYFRIKQIKYSYVKGISEIDLIECV
jgi:hypothetical protein